MTIGFFSILLNVRGDDRMSIIFLSDFQRLSINEKEISTHLAVLLFSMSGFPPLGGFIGKFLIYVSAIRSNLFVLIFISLIFSTISTYYYLKMLRIVYFEDI